LAKLAARHLLQFFDQLRWSRHTNRTSMLASPTIQTSTSRPTARTQLARILDGDSIGPVWLTANAVGAEMSI
jgi:hypothetical protein